jgi:hypothetical protein
MRLVAGFPQRRHGFEARSGNVGFVVDKVALGQGFSKYFGFPCQFSFHQMLHTHLSSGAGTIGQLVADVPSGFSPTPPHKKKKKNYNTQTDKEALSFFSLTSTASPIICYISALAL